MGVSHYPEEGRELETLVAKADERLYRAKRDGKDRVCGDDGAAEPPPATAVAAP